MCPNAVNNYITNRTIKWDYMAETIECATNFVDPRGSIVGPVLWNVFYSIWTLNMAMLMIKSYSMYQCQISVV